MNDIEKKALYQIIQISDKAQEKVTQASLKTHRKEIINPENDLYPVGYDLREIQYWAKAILDNVAKP